MSNFSNLGIEGSMEQHLKGMGIAQPTEVQEKTIPLLLEGKDIIAQSQTGSGKTLAFVLPILEQINPENKSVQALILTPTRELALQITSVIEQLTDVIELVSVAGVYGGKSVDQQLAKLKRGAQIVVATPGRLLDHLRRGSIDLSEITNLVLDEADQMLHIGFLDEVEDIIEETPSTRQTMLFSATMPSKVKKLANQHMKSPVHIKVSKSEVNVADIKQMVIETTDRAKQEALCQTIDHFRPFLAIIFCRTKRRVSKLNGALKSLGYSADELHGDLSQAKRERVMKRFRNCEIQLLVATDVAARGIDVEGITHIFNYDVPEEVESYVHRIGRTGRAGGTGLAVTFIAKKDHNELMQIEKGLGLSLSKRTIDELFGNERTKEINESDANERSKSSKSRKRKR